jgi:putative ABC transport system permease protein
VDVFRGVELRYRGERATLGAGNFEVVRRYGRLRFLSGGLPGPEEAIVSEPFANRHGVRTGDTLRLSIGEATPAFRVAGVYYEYSSSQGFVLLDRATLLRYLPGRPPSNAAVYLAAGADAAAVQHEAQRRLAGLNAAVAPNGELRRNAIAIFDRTFAITWALEAVAIVVAMLGAANSLLALVLDRRRELGLLRYLGASAGQSRRMILTEAALLGGLATLIGLAVGLALSLLLIFVVNKQSFGWTIQFQIPVGLLGGALLLVWVATVAAAWYPARVAANLDPLEATHEE